MTTFFVLDGNSANLVAEQDIISKGHYWNSPALFSRHVEGAAVLSSFEAFTEEDAEEIFREFLRSLEVA